MKYKLIANVTENLHFILSVIFHDFLSCLFVKQLVRVCCRREVTVFELFAFVFFAGFPFVSFAIGFTFTIFWFCLCFVNNWLHLFFVKHFLVLVSFDHWLLLFNFLFFKYPLLLLSFNNWFQILLWL